MLWKWTPDGECEICPSCGFTAHADFWFEEQFLQLPSEHEMAPKRVGPWLASHIKNRPMMKARGIALPSSQPQDTAAGGEHG